MIFGCYRYEETEREWQRPPTAWGIYDIFAKWIHRVPSNTHTHTETHQPTDQRSNVTRDRISPSIYIIHTFTIESSTEMERKKKKYRPHTEILWSLVEWVQVHQIKLVRSQYTSNTCYTVQHIACIAFNT